MILLSFKISTLSSILCQVLCMEDTNRKHFPGCRAFTCLSVQKLEDKKWIKQRSNAKEWLHALTLPNNKNLSKNNRWKWKQKHKGYKKNASDKNKEIVHFHLQLGDSKSNMDICMVSMVYCFFLKKNNFRKSKPSTNKLMRNFKSS